MLSLNACIAKHRPKVSCVVTLLAALFLPQASRAQSAIIDAVGRVEGAERVMSIGAAVSGIVSQVLVHEGERVQSGQTLVKLDCQAIEADLRGREAQLRAAQATYDRYRNGSRPDEIQVGEAAVRYSAARADEAEKALARADAMQEGVTITTARVLEIRRDARIARAQLEEARARLSLLRVGPREEDIRHVEALRDLAVAQVDAGRAQLDKCVIRAPADGTVLDVLTNPGQFLSVAVPQPLLQIVPDGLLHVRIDVVLRDITHVCRSQTATVTTDVVPNANIQAEVASISPLVEPGISTAFPEPGGRVVSVLLDLDRNAPLLPIGSSVGVHLDPCYAQMLGAR